MHSHQMSQDVFKNTINKNPKNSILKQNNYANRIPSEKSMSTIDMNSSFHSKVKQVQINK
jgi:transposase